MTASFVSGPGASAQLYAFGAATVRSAELQVATKEGDRVTLSMSSTRTVGYAGASTTTGGTAAAEAWQVSGSDRVSLSVEGTLSKDELHDIAKVLKVFQRAAAKGDARQLLHRLTRPDLDTVGSVAARATSERTVLGATTPMTAAPPLEPEPAAVTA